VSCDDNYAYDLRPIRHKDCQAIWEILKDPQVQSFNDYKSDLTKGDVYDFIQGDIEGFYNQQGIRLVIVLRSNGLVIGSIGLFNIIDGQGVLGFELASHYFGKGIMQKVLLEFFQKLNVFITTPVDKVHAIVQPENTACIKLLAKCGFELNNELWTKHIT